VQHETNQSSGSDQSHIQSSVTCIKRLATFTVFGQHKNNLWAPFELKEIDIERGIELLILRSQSNECITASLEHHGAG
jgi:hypothetical protein